MCHQIWKYLPSFPNIRAIVVNLPFIFSPILIFERETDYTIVNQSFEKKNRVLPPRTYIQILTFKALNQENVDEIWVSKFYCHKQTEEFRFVFGMFYILKVIFNELLLLINDYICLISSQSVFLYLDV